MRITSAAGRLVLVAAFAAAGVGAWAGCSGSQGGLGSSDAGDGSAGSSSGGASGSGSGGASGSGSGGVSGSGSGGGSGGSSGGGSGSGSGGSSGSSGGGSGSSSGSVPDGGCPPCNPANVNLPGVDCDLDCSGTTTAPASCDTGLATAGVATDFAKALGVCQTASATTWGLVSATYTQGYNSTVAPAAGAHGILPGFGTAVMPREGANLGVLSSGWAMQCDDPSATASCGASGTGDPYFKGAQTAMDATNSGIAPPGYPKSTAQCVVASTVFDTIGVTLQIKVPQNATGMSLDFDFYSSEWPEYVCSSYNDQFVAWLQSEAWVGANGAGDLNIAWDSTGAGISVNSPFLTQCTPSTPTGCDGTVMGTAACSATGPMALQGTGFYNLGTYCTSQSTGGGATGWLTATAPVKGGETITLQLIIWDTGDANWDSSVLLDHLQWYGTPTPAGTKPAM